MKAATLIALKGSIAKWKAIVAGTGADAAAENCPLCQMFDPSHGDCRGCPVAAAVGEIGCMNTPWENWTGAQGLSYPWLADTEERKRLARAELKFLRSLLPKPKKSAKPAKRRANK